MRRTAVVLLPLLFALETLAPAAKADPSTKSDPAAAQALFYEARNLLKQNKPALACPKLEESLRLDYGIGTEFNLADCNERLGKIASAWSGFLSVASSAKAQNQPQREKIARDRAKALEPRLPKLTIDVPRELATISGFEVKRDGVPLGAAAYGTSVPVDPGAHRITASAPGYESWDSTLQTPEGKPIRVSVPQLLKVSTEPVASVVPAAPPPREAPGPAFPDPVVEKSSTQRTLGYIAGGLGIAGLGVAAGFGIDSLQRRERSQDHCIGDVCDARGVDLRDQAIRSGNVATVASIAGGAAFLGGLVLVLTSPKSGRKETGRTTVVPNVAMSGAGLSVQGLIP